MKVWVLQIIDMDDIEDAGDITLHTSIDNAIKHLRSTETGEMLADDQVNRLQSQIELFVDKGSISIDDTIYIFLFEKELH